MATLNVIGGERSHDTLQRVLSRVRPCKILDVPTGRGVLAKFLQERGWEVHSADIDPGNFRLDDIPFTQVNLNRTLPFDDGEFDAVSCINGLHRLLFPEVAVREFFRILRPGGRLYVNLNNYSSIAKRLRFLLTGSLDEELDSQDCIQTTDDPEANVRLPLLYPRLKDILEQTGFQIVDVQPAAVAHRDRILAPIAVMVRGASSLIRPFVRPQLRRVLENHPAIVAGGSYFFVCVEKPRAQ